MRTWSVCYGVDTVCLRYFNIFGTRQAADSAYAAVIPAFVTRYLDGQSPTVFGDGEQTRDFTHVSNAVLANLLGCVSKEALGGRVMNIGAGVRTSVNELAGMIAKVLGTQGIGLDYQDERVGEVRDSVADVGLAQELIGYEPTTGIEAGLEETVRWYADEHVKKSAGGME